MPTPSPRLGIPNYTESDTPVDIPTAWLARSAVLDTLVPISQGTLAQRPVSSPSTAGIIGRQAIVTGETDSPRVDLDLGSSWITLGPPMKDGPPDIPGSRSLGTNAGQAAPGNSTSLSMPGDLKLSAAANPSPGWLLCNGTAVSRTTYPALFAAIGIAYGAGDGSTTFALPDYRGRTIVGAGAGSGLLARAVGETGGEENHTLAIAEMPWHNHGGATGGGTSGSDSPDHGHTIPDPGHSHVGPGGYGIVGSQSGVTHGVFNPSGGTGLIQGNGPFNTGNTGAAGTGITATVGASARHAHAVPALSIPAQGGGTGHNVMQPFTVANVFIKT